MAERIGCRDDGCVGGPGHRARVAVQLGARGAAAPGRATGGRATERGVSATPATRRRKATRRKATARLPPPQGCPPPPGAYPYPYPPPPGYPYPPRYVAPPPDPPASATHLGIGYKIGNGLGFLGGDVIIGPAPHLAIDVQVNKFDVPTDSGNANGYGLAPALQLYLRPPGVSTPYLSLGYAYATVSIDNVRASVHGGFANAGYEWKWSNGLAIVVGGGALVLARVTATDGVRTVSIDGGWAINIEAGLRFMLSLSAMAGPDVSTRASYTACSVVTYSVRRSAPPKVQLDGGAGIGILPARRPSPSANTRIALTSSLLLVT